MTQALRQLAQDFLSAILFFAIYLLTGSLYAGAGIAIAVGVGQLLRLRLLGRPIAPMQWMSLALVVVLGGATVLLHTPRLMLIKPSIAHFAVAAIMLRRGWMTPYLPPIVQQQVPPSVIVAAGYAWAALLAALGAANLFLAMFGDLTTWAWFASFGAIGAKGVALLAQYLVFRAIVRRQLVVARRLAPAAVMETP
jgi:intracellular septation protein A